MAVSKSALRLKRTVENITPNVEHCRLLILARKIVIEDIMGTVWPVIEPVAHGVGFGYTSYVWGYSSDLRYRTLMVRPP